MEKDKEVTDVIFKRFKDGDVIAFFPGDAGTMDENTCSSYTHFGQHGAASVDLCPTLGWATKAKIEPLQRELEGLGYNLRLVKRFTPTHRASRRAQINR